MAKDPKLIYYTLCIAFIWAGAYLAGLNSMELRGEEGLRVLPGVAMLKSGNWILPEISGRPYLNKPPMINWLCALSIKLCGRQDEWSARLPSALFPLVFAGFLIILPNRAFTPDQRMIMALLYLTTISILERGRLIEIESVYVASTGLALYWWLRGWLGQYSSWSMWLGSSIFLTLGLFTKGPVIIIVFYLVVLLVAIYAHKWRSLFCAAHFLSILIWAGLFIVWTQAASSQVQTDRMLSRWSSEILIRFWPDNLNWMNRLEVFGRSFLNLMPWLLLAGLLWKKSIINSLENDKQKTFRAIRNAGVSGFIMITLLPASEARYSMPVIPILCLLLGWIIPLLPANPNQDKQLLKTLSIAISLLSVTALILYAITGYHKIGLMPVTLGILMSFGVWRYRSQLTGSVKVLSVLACAIMLGSMNYAIFGGMLIEDHQSRKPWGLRINEILPPEKHFMRLIPRSKYFCIIYANRWTILPIPARLTTTFTIC